MTFAPSDPYSTSWDPSLEHVSYVSYPRRRRDEKRARRTLARVLPTLEPFHTSTLASYVVMRRREQLLRSEPEERCDSEILSQRLALLTPEERRLFIRLLERGDLSVLEKRKRKREYLFVSGETKGLEAIKVDLKGMVVANSTVAMAGKFEENAGGPEGVIAKLEAVEDDPKMPPAVQAVLVLLRRDPNKGLARCVAEAGAGYGQVVKWVAAGADLLGEFEGRVLLREGQATTIQNLHKIASSGLNSEVCPGCNGEKRITEMVDGRPAFAALCPACSGTGLKKKDPDTMAAIKTVMEATKMIGGGGGVSVGVAIQNNAPSSSAAFEQQVEVVDRVMRASKERVEEVVAEVVEKGK